MNDCQPQPGRQLAVIMSVYHKDDPAWFRESLESIFSQTISTKFCIKLYLAVDGPIGPEIDQVISDYDQEIYRIFRFSDNNGLAASLNALIDHLEQEPFVFRMDADDISLPERFEKQISFMEQNPDLDVLGGAILEVGELRPVSTIVQYPMSNAEARRQIAFRSPVAHPTVCFRKRVFEVAGTYPEIRGNEDIAFWFKCMKANMVFANLPDPVLRFRISPDFLARRGFQKSKSEMFCYLNGLNSLEGPSIRMALPILRFMFRLTPKPIRRLGYSLRRKRRR